ncbi:galactosylceramide sulfotransferase isoform X2 [Cherax quadricarinatus]|uniref:galactosylceramide sulfotransferase isoform X2 n=1 Tax=Cherax quadricarinatus TaxID=27406 RepID=UPI002377DB47|nr:galactosylceramide sulfotransferase-like isoform X2 [Cherax quadricarinatus]
MALTMIKKKDSKVTKKKESGGPTLMVKMLVLLCVVSSMALVLQLNLTNQQNLLLREEPRAWSAQRAVPTCRPRRHLVFLKTHKCGSSTIQNVLMRYADAHNLSVALPYSGVYLDAVAEGQSLKVKKLKDSPFAPPSGRYHFLIHHTRLNVRAIQQLTYDDSVWVTIVREPSAVFESMFHYYHLHKFYGSTFDHLIWKLEGNAGSKAKFKNANSRYMGRLGKNQMTWDLGLDDLDMRQESLLKEAIRILDQNFHLVMVAERMDESLVLMKHLLCWGDDDVVAMARNVRRDRYRSYLSEHSVNTLEHFNAADVKLYAFFKERFDKHIEAFGRSRMEEEVATLRELRDKVWKECGLREADITTFAKRRSYSDKERHLVVQYKTHHNGSTRLRKFCNDLIRPSTEYTQKLRWKQYSRYHHTNNNPWNLTWSSYGKKKKKTSRRASVTGRRNHAKGSRPNNDGIFLNHPHNTPATSIITTTEQELTP